MRMDSKRFCVITFVFVFLVSVPSYAQQPADSAVFTGIPTYNVGAIDERLNIDTSWRRLQNAVIASEINGEDYECTAPTDLHLWIGEKVGELDALGPTLDILDVLSVFSWAGDAKLLLDNDASDEYIGVNGEYTKEQIKRHKDNKRFWDILSDDILLMGMHGAVIADDAKMVQLINLVTGNPQVSQYVVDTVQTIIEGGFADVGPLLGAPGPVIIEFPGVPSGYNHPLFTFNAFAFSDEGMEIFPGFGLLPDKIVMGEGLLEGMEAIGLGKNSPDVIYAHEFAHHVQFEIGAFEPGPPTPEGTRRTELMADAFGAYYASHARGATLQVKNFVDVMTSASVVGDCQFANPNHHGTPNQREASALWGGSVSDGAQKQGHINSSFDMLYMFDEELPNLLAPDAP